jgi:hypothetical protein
MPVVHATIRVAEDGSSGTAPRELPPGEYQAPIAAPEPKRKRRRLDLPLHDSGTWDDHVCLRREDIYGPDGR